MSLRLLFAFAGGSGHLEPLVPLARAAAASGHAVAWCGRPWMVARVQALNFIVFSAGTDEGLAPQPGPLLEVDRDRELLDLRDGFAGRIARERAADLVPVCDRWRPDLIVWEETDFGAGVVAEHLGLAHAAVQVTASGAVVRPAHLAPVIDRLRASMGDPPDPSGAMLSRHLVLSGSPPSLRDPAFPAPRTLRGVRLTARPPADPGAPPAWATVWPGRPVVYATLGTVFNHESGDLFARLLQGLASLDANCLLTVGHEIDPTSFGPQPDHVRIERFIPQAEVLPHADVAISHAGSGSVVGALAHGLPMVLLPMGADQPWNADRIEALGAGRTLDALRATPEEIRDTVLETVADPTARAAAACLRAEIDTLPPPSTAITWLEGLADRRPTPHRRAVPAPR